VRAEHPHLLAWVGARYVGLYGILVVLAWSFGEPAFERLKPAFKHELSALLPEFNVQTVDVVRSGREPAVRLDAIVHGAVFAGTQLTPVESGTRLSVSTTLGHIWQPVMLVVTFGFAWPASTARRAAIRALAVVLLCGLIVFADVPFVLAGTLRDIIYGCFAPDEYAMATRWGDFMDGGGRLALGLSAGLICAALGATGPTAKAR